MEGADLQPAVKGRILRGYEYNNVGIGLDAGLVQGRNVPLLPAGYESRQRFVSSVCFALCGAVYAASSVNLPVVLLSISSPTALLGGKKWSSSLLRVALHGTWRLG